MIAKVAESEVSTPKSKLDIKRGPGLAPALYWDRIYEAGSDVKQKIADSAEGAAERLRASLAG